MEIPWRFFIAFCIFQEERIKTMHPEPARPPPAKSSTRQRKNKEKRGLTMIYLKTYDKNGNIQEQPMIDTEIFCNCPRCGKEIEISAEYWDFLGGNSNFDPFESAIYCDSCVADMNEMRDYINEHISASLEHAPSEELSKVLDFVQKYKK